MPIQKAHSETGDPLLLTPGPLTTSAAVKQAMVHDWGSRDANFIAINKMVLEKIAELAGATGTHVTVPVQGSGTFAVEAMITSFVPKTGKLLLLINGAYGSRAKKIAEIAGRAVAVHETPEDTPPDLAKIEAMLAGDKAITHVFAVHCETTSGILNPIQAIAELVEEVFLTRHRFHPLGRVDAQQPHHVVRRHDALGVDRSEAGGTRDGERELVSTDRVVAHHGVLEREQVAVGGREGGGEVLGAEVAAVDQHLTDLHALGRCLTFGVRRGVLAAAEECHDRSGSASVGAVVGEVGECRKGGERPRRRSRGRRRTGRETCGRSAGAAVGPHELGRIEFDERPLDLLESLELHHGGDVHGVGEFGLDLGHAQV